MNNEITKKIDEINDKIENSEIYLKYLKLQDQISHNKELMELINRIRVMQKDVIHKKEDKEKLMELTCELNSHPLYREYSNTIYEINNIYGIIESNLNKYFDRIIN